MVYTGQELKCKFTFLQKKREGEQPPHRPVPAALTFVGD